MIAVNWEGIELPHRAIHGVEIAYISMSVFSVPPSFQILSNWFLALQ